MQALSEIDKTTLGRTVRREGWIVLKRKSCQASCGRESTRDSCPAVSDNHAEQGKTDGTTTDRQ
jgi:hypothetical protein